MNDDLQPLALLLAQAERQRYDALAEQLKAKTAKRAAEAQAEQLVDLPARVRAALERGVLSRRQDRARPLLPGLRPAPDAGGRAAAARRRACRGAGRARRGDRARPRGARRRAEEADRAAPARERSQRRSQRAEGKRRPRRARVVEPAYRARPGALPVSVAMNTGSARGASVAAPLVGAPIVQAAPTPADKPAPAGAQPASNRFAELLRRNRAEAPKPAAPEPTPTARADATADQRRSGRHVVDRGEGRAGECSQGTSGDAEGHDREGDRRRSSARKRQERRGVRRRRQRRRDAHRSPARRRWRRPIASNPGPLPRWPSTRCGALPLQALPGATTRPDPGPKSAMPPPPSAQRPGMAAGTPAAWHRSMQRTTLARRPTPRATSRCA